MTRTRERDAGGVAVLDRIAAREIRAVPAATDLAIDIVDHWGMHSFPASDPPANW